VQKIGSGTQAVNLVFMMELLTRQFSGYPVKRDEARHHE
jgi:hypothetical protein